MNTDSSNIMVTVICMTYNHSKFIKKALEGFQSQKTDFLVEYIIHDDASTDGTAKIIMDFCKKNPDCFIPIIQDENQYRKHKDISTALFQRARGKYIAICEGDDYWCDSMKLQHQVDYMEKNPDTSLFVHNAYKYDMLSETFIPINPYPRQGVLSTKEVLTEIGGKLPPTASMLFRADIVKKMPMEIFRAPVGDRPLRMFLAIAGKVYYSNKLMSVYRTNNPNSFSGKLVDYERSKALAEQMKDFYDRFDKYTDYIYHDEVNMLIEMEFYGHYSRFNMIREIRNNLYYKKRINKRHKLIVEIRGVFPLEFINKIREIKKRLNIIKNRMNTSRMEYEK